MGISKSRLILVPQYPAALRYQEWWDWYLEQRYLEHFDEVIRLGPELGPLETRTPQQQVVGFAPVEESLRFEILQMHQFLSLELQDSDILLLHDLSFPGLFASMLLHKRPVRCFAICHATSKNRYDLFQSVRRIKYPLEKAHSRLFNGVFVASEYHARKLGRQWYNLHVVKFPLPPYKAPSEGTEPRSPSYPRLLSGVDLRDGLPTKQSGELLRGPLFVSAARPGKQKVNKKLEGALEAAFCEEISRADPAVCQSWTSYYEFLGRAAFLIVTSKEETYGYQVIDAMLCGTTPVAPNAMSYPELLPRECLYVPGSPSSLIDTVHRLIAEGPPKLHLPDNSFFETTSSIMLNGSKRP